MLQLQIDRGVDSEASLIDPVAAVLGKQMFEEDIGDEIRCGTRFNAGLFE
jgi:hypothetical protein